MTERDVFEVRLEAAVRGYARRVSSGLDPIEFARQIATAEPRRHGLRIALGRLGIEIPRRAWVLLLLAAVLTALVAGTMLVGSRSVQKLPAVVPPVPAVVPPVGPALACPPGSTPDTPGPVDQARPPEAAMGMAFDGRAGKLVAVTSAGEAVETWTFDVCTNTWALMNPSGEPRRFDWAQLVYDIDSDATILVSSGKVWAYDLQANAWTERGAAPTDNAAFLAYDPISGLVVVAADYSDRKLLWNYEVETDRWTPIHQADGPGYAELAYDASVDRIVAYAFGATSIPETWLFDIRTGTWSRSSAVTPGIVAGWGLPHTIVYEEGAERTVILSNSGLAAYDATADRWELVIGGDPGSVPDTMVYDPVNRRLVGPGTTSPDVIGVPADFVAFDLTTREWTVLLETGDGQPTPSSE
jgi:hypothetical protein